MFGLGFKGLGSRFRSLGFRVFSFGFQGVGSRF